MGRAQDPGTDRRDLGDRSRGTVRPSTGDDVTRGARHSVGPDGNRLVLPEGWVRLNVRDYADRVVRAALESLSFDSLPRDERPRRRAAIEGRLRLAMDNAKKIDAFALYVPLGDMHGMAVPASFVVAEATDFASGGPESDVLMQLLAGPGATQALLVTLGGCRKPGTRLIPVTWSPATRGTNW